MQVGDLVKVIHDGTTGLVVRVEDDTLTPGGYCPWTTPWVWLHTGEVFRSDKLEVINESR